MNSDIDISKIKKLDTALLLVLQELLVQKSVTRAARSLNLSQSAISHSLSRLRELFDDPLFIRRPHGLEPTQRALDLKPRVDEIIELTARTLGIGQSFNPIEARRLFTISAPEFVTVAIGGRLLKHMARVAPGTGVTFGHLGTREVISKLSRGELDVAIGRFDNFVDSELIVEPLYEDDYCVVARKGHPKIRRRISRKLYSELAHLWASAEGEVTNVELDTDYSEFYGSIVPRWLTALSMAAQTDMIVACPRRLAENQAELLDLNIYPLPFENAPVTVSLARRTRVNDEGTKWFIDQILHICEVG